MSGDPKNEDKDSVGMETEGRNEPKQGQPLTAESVGLLKAGDWCRSEDGPFQLEADFDWLPGFISFRVGTDQSRSVTPEMVSFIGTPGTDGFIPWSGGENPVPGQTIEHQIALRMPKGPSENFDWRFVDRFRLTPTSPPIEDAERAGDGVAPTCQDCGGEIAGWLCQTCPREFEENDAGALVFMPTDQVSDVEVLRAQIDEITNEVLPPARDGTNLGVKARAMMQVEIANKFLALIARSQPKGAGQSSGELIAIDRSQWEPCSPAWLEKHPRDCATAPRVAAPSWDGHSHYHPVNWPTDNADGLSADRPDPTGQDLAAIGCAETAVGRAVYQRIDTLAVAVEGSPEFEEAFQLRHLVASVEEVGGYDGPIKRPQSCAEIVEEVRLATGWPSLNDTPPALKDRA